MRLVLLAVVLTGCSSTASSESPPIDDATSAADTATSDTFAPDDSALTDDSASSDTTAGDVGAADSASSDTTIDGTAADSVAMDSSKPDAVMDSATEADADAHVPHVKCKTADGTIYEACNGVKSTVNIGWSGGGFCDRTMPDTPGDCAPGTNCTVIFVLSGGSSKTGLCE